MTNQSLDLTKRTAFSGIVIALAVALGFALSFIPNVELVTLTIALGGAILGPVRGAVTGAVAFAIYSILSPYGVAPPPLFLAQVISGAIIGMVGGFLVGIERFHLEGWAKALLFGVIGAGITFIYDLFTNIGAFIVVASSETLIPFLIGGIAFSAVHILANGLIFGILMPLLLRTIGVKIGSQMNR